MRYQAGGPRRMPGKWPHIVGPPDQPGEGGGGGARHHGCSVQLSRGGQAAVQLRNTRRCHGIHGTSRRAPAQQLKKQRSPTVSQIYAQQSLRPTTKPMPGSSKCGPSGREGTDSEGSSAGQLGHDKTWLRHGQAEDAEPQQRSAGSCITTPHVTEARPHLTRCAACNVFFTAAGTPPGCERRTSRTRQSHFASRQDVEQASEDCPVRQGPCRRSLGRLGTRPQPACPSRSSRRKNNSERPGRQKSPRRHQC